VFEFVEANRAVFPIAVMCRVLGVSTSGYYGWRQRPPSERALADEVLTEQIRLVHAQSRQTYGYRRIRAELVDGHGVAVGRHRVARLMRRAGISGVTRRKFCRTTRRDDRAQPVPDLLRRDFSAAAPDRRWVADVTYVSTWSGFLFLAVVVDVFSRRVVGWSMSARQDTVLVTNALRMAVARRRPNGVVVHHSDQGCQYTSYDFAQACRKAGVERSMGSVGDCYDNALAESFFATLECELLDRTVFENRNAARLAIFDFIESFYNPWRRHSSIGDLSPVEFERRWHAESDSCDAA
jgi:putative transposase